MTLRTSYRYLEKRRWNVCLSFPRPSYNTPNDLRLCISPLSMFFCLGKCLSRCLFLVKSWCSDLLPRHCTSVLLPSCMCTRPFFNPCNVVLLLSSLSSYAIIVHFFSLIVVQKYAVKETQHKERKICCRECNQLKTLINVYSMYLGHTKSNDVTQADKQQKTTRKYGIKNY